MGKGYTQGSPESHRDADLELGLTFKISHLISVMEKHEKSTSKDERKALHADLVRCMEEVLEKEKYLGPEWPEQLRRVLACPQG